MKPGLVAFCACCLVAAALALPHPPTVDFTPATEEQAGISIQPPATPGAAAGLAYTAHCLDTNPRQGLIALTWEPAAAAIGGQRIDVSKLHEGFAVGRFDVSPILDATVRAVGLRDPEPGVYYYWRVLGDTAEGWVASEEGRFEAPVCPSDGPVFDRVEEE